MQSFSVRDRHPTCPAFSGYPLLHMGAGWLAREGKLGFVQERGVLKCSLHPSSGPPA